MTIRKINGKKGKRGFTVVELLVALGIISLMFTLAIPGFDSYFKRVRLNNALRTVTGVLNNARYNAIMLNKPVKFSVEVQNDENMILLKKQQDDVWVEFKQYPVKKEISLYSNASPVFYPGGSVAPLCSVYVGNDIHQYRITISIAGRIKVIEMED